MDWNDRDKLEKQSISKALISLALPAVASTFFAVIFEFIDMFWVGRLGPESIAALGGASFFVWMLRGLGLTIATGTIALVSRRVGEKNIEGLLDAVGGAIGSTLVFTLLVTAICLPVALYVFQWLGLEPVVGMLAGEYTIVFISGLVFVYLMLTMEFIIRGVGDTRTPMKIIGIALLLNTVLDPLFMFYFGLGLRGAAFATILSQAIGSVLMAVVLYRKISPLKTLKLPGKEFFTVTLRRQFLTIARIGGPIGFTDAGFSFIYLLLSGIIAIFGSAPLAAIGIAHRYEGFPFFICLGFSMAVEPMVGQFLGSGNVERAKQTVYLALKITVGVLVFISLSYFIFAPALYRFFTDDAGIISHGIVYLRIVAFSDIFLSFEVILSGAFSGAGDTKPPLWINLPLTFARLPFGYLFAVTLGGGIHFLWIVIGASTVIKGLLLFYQFRKGHWATKKV